MRALFLSIRWETHLLKPHIHLTVLRRHGQTDFLAGSSPLAPRVEHKALPAERCFFLKVLLHAKRHHMYLSGRISANLLRPPGSQITLNSLRGIQNRRPVRNPGLMENGEASMLTGEPEAASFT